MTDSITLSGTVATVPNHRQITEDLDVVSFRLASTQWRFDPATKQFIEGLTSWYTVSCFRRLAQAAQHTVHKGQRVVVGGRLRVREWEKDDRRGTSVEIDADVVGVDIGWLSRHQPGPGGEQAAGSPAAGISDIGPGAAASSPAAVDASGWALPPMATGGGAAAAGADGADGVAGGGGGAAGAGVGEASDGDESADDRYAGSFEPTPF